MPCRKPFSRKEEEYILRTRGINTPGDIPRARGVPVDNTGRPQNLHRMHKVAVEKAILLMEKCCIRSYKLS
jgi:hypothetical protein